MFFPKVNGDLTVTLPGELLRAKVTKVVDRNLVFVEIGQPMTRGHNFRLGDLIACRRTPGVLGESWQAIEIRPTVSLPQPERKPDAQVAEPTVAKAKGRVAKVSTKPKQRVKR